MATEKYDPPLEWVDKALSDKLQCDPHGFTVKNFSNRTFLLCLRPSLTVATRYKLVRAKAKVRTAVEKSGYYKISGGTNRVLYR